LTFQSYRPFSQNLNNRNDQDEDKDRYKSKFDNLFTSKVSKEELDKVKEKERQMQQRYQDE